MTDRQLHIWGKKKERRIQFCLKINCFNLELFINKVFCTRGGCLNYHKLASSEQEHIIFIEKQKTKHNIESQEHLFSFILGQEEGTVAVVGSTVLSVFSVAPP